MTEIRSLAVTLSLSCGDGSNSPHRGVDDGCGSLEVWFADGRESGPNTLTREQAIDKAMTLARAEMDKLDKSE
jgi:hypothetical protein